MNQIYYHLPGAFEFFNIYKYFIPMFYNNRSKFYDFANIYCLYGCPAYFSWSGGRGGFQNSNYSDYKFVKSFYDSYNIAISITATNLLLTETDLYDKYCNKVLEYYNEPKNSIIISNEILHKYIMKNYKNYILISSTTKCLNAEETLKEYENNYDFVVLDYNLNNNWDFLNNLTDKLKSKTEFLVNHACGIKCQNRKQHYIEISKSNLYKYNSNLYNDCKWQFITFFDSIKRPYIITIDRIQNEYIPKGFTHFKIEGRNQSTLQLFYALIHYLVKPEYHDEILYTLFDLYQTFN